MANTNRVSRAPTLVEEMLAEDAYDRRYGREVQELEILEPEQLARHIEETQDADPDPRYDFGSHLTAGLDDMRLVDRKRFNMLTRKLLIGEITVAQQAELNDIMVRAMLAHGLNEVRAALNQASVRHEVAATVKRLAGGGQ